jgi:hypothetical protein
VSNSLSLKLSTQYPSFPPMESSSSWGEVFYFINLVDSVRWNIVDNIITEITWVHFIRAHKKYKFNIFRTIKASSGDTSEYNTIFLLMMP